MPSNISLQSRIRGVAVGSAVGDALGMPLEFKPPRPPDRLVTGMLEGVLPAGSFTDDTEMALAVAESLLAACPLDPQDLAGRFVDWHRRHPADIGIHTADVLGRLASGSRWEQAAHAVQQRNPDNAPNGSIMRCWPVAIAHHKRPAELDTDSRLQGQVTHVHPECVSATVFLNRWIVRLLEGCQPGEAFEALLRETDLPPELILTLRKAPGRDRSELINSGWVRHTLESAVWGLLTTSNFEQAVVQVANLGRDADTAAAVMGALAGAAYGLESIPDAWREQLSGEWPIRSGRRLRAADFVALADQLAAL